MGMDEHEGKNGALACSPPYGDDGGITTFAREILEQRGLLRINVDSMIRTMDDHNVRGVPLKDEHCRAFAEVAAALMQEQSPKLRFLGAKLVDTGLRYNLTRFEKAEHSARLDTPGVPTERTEHLMGLKIIKGLEEGDI